MILFFLVFSACSTTSNLYKEKSSLAQLLIPITKSEKQARILANEAYSFSLKMKKDYDLISWPFYNNFLVNLGFKKRGLCWQLTFDLLNHLKKSNFSVDYYIAGANINKYFSEHNALVLTCKGCDFKDGILLDAWRNGGELFYSPVSKDKKYTWKQRGTKRN